MSAILGINTFHAGASAAVIIDGVPVVAIAEERPNRKKYFAGFPKLAVQKCLDTAGLKFQDIDAVAVGRDSSANLHKNLEFALRNPSQLLNFARMRTKKRSLDDAIWNVTADGKCEEIVKFKKDRWHPTLFMFGTIPFPYGNGPADELYFYLVGVRGDNRTFRIRREDERL